MIERYDVLDEKEMLRIVEYNDKLDDDDLLYPCPPIVNRRGVDLITTLGFGLGLGVGFNVGISVGVGCIVGGIVVGTSVG